MFESRLPCQLRNCTRCGSFLFFSYTRNPRSQCSLGSLFCDAIDAALRVITIAIPSLRSLRIASPLPFKNYILNVVLFLSHSRNPRSQCSLGGLLCDAIDAALRVVTIAIPSLRSLRIASPLPTQELHTLQFLFCFSATHATPRS